MLMLDSAAAEAATDEDDVVTIAEFLMLSLTSACSPMASCLSRRSVDS